MTNEMKMANLQNAKNQLALLQRQCGNSRVRLNANAKKLARLEKIVEMLEQQM